MSLQIPICSACGRAAFPPRVLCPHCGGNTWRVDEVETGALEAVTERDGVRIAAVRTTAGPVVIARFEGEASGSVRLDQDGEVPVAR